MGDRLPILPGYMGDSYFPVIFDFSLKITDLIFNVANTKTIRTGGDVTVNAAFVVKHAVSPSVKSPILSTIAWTIGVVQRIPVLDSMISLFSTVCPGTCQLWQGYRI